MTEKEEDPASEKNEFYRNWPQKKEIKCHSQTQAQLTYTIVVNWCKVWFVWPAIMWTTTCGCLCFRQALPYWRFPFDWLKWLLFMLFKLFIAVVGETILTFVEFLLILLLFILLVCDVDDDDADKDNDVDELIFKLLKLLFKILLVICELGLIMWLLFNWFSSFELPHALSSVNISVKYPGSALMRSMFILILLTMSSDLKLYIKERIWKRRIRIYRGVISTKTICNHNDDDFNEASMR